MEGTVSLAKSKFINHKYDNKDIGRLPKTAMKFLFLVLLWMNSSTIYGQDYQFKKIKTSTEASFRGLSVVDNNVAWISGSKGQTGVTTDGGIHWNFQTVKGFEESDFRSLYAFDDRHAIIANAGSPAAILITNDGGKNWNSVYTNTHKDAFIDGVDFWNEKEGLVYGDPLDGKMLLLRTADGGLTWSELKNAPLLESGEASFAASGTGIRCTNLKDVTICTGGTVSRLWISHDKGESWTTKNTPIVQGEPTTGIFSFIKNELRLTIVGGDFKNDSLRVNHNFYSPDDGQTWSVPSVTTNGYRECVEAITKNILLAVGPSGADISYDNGITWKALATEKGLHVVRKARKGSLIIAAGSKGQLCIFK